jgi:hypothetical protein
MNDYITTFNSNAECEVSDSEVQYHFYCFSTHPFFIQISSYEEGFFNVFRTCHSQIYNSNSMCSRDSDCPSNVPCDLESHLCAPLSEIQEENFFSCIYNNVGTGILASLGEYINLPPSSTNEELYIALRQYTLNKDCMASTGLNLPFHFYYTFDWSEADCTDFAVTYYGYPMGEVFGVDSSLDLGPSSLETYCGQRTFVCVQDIEIHFKNVN